MSDAIKALAKAQTEMGKAIKNAKNPHLKSNYADLGSVMEACFDALHANGFAIMQPCGADERGQYVETVLAHASGDTFTSRVHLVVSKNDMQGVGSAITYARRYGLLGMAGLAPEDDDGEATKAAPRQQATNRAPAGKADQDAAAQAVEYINGAENLDDLKHRWEALPDAMRKNRDVIGATNARKAQLQQKEAA